MVGGGRLSTAARGGASDLKNRSTPLDATAEPAIHMTRSTNSFCRNWASDCPIITVAGGPVGVAARVAPDAAGRGVAKADGGMTGGAASKSARAMTKTEPMRAMPTRKTRIPRIAPERRVLRPCKFGLGAVDIR